MIHGIFLFDIDPEHQIKRTNKGKLHDESNNNGTRFIDFATPHDLRIKSTMIEHKNIHKRTWVSSDGKTWNQIDHILIDTRHASNCLDVQSLRRADANSDHFLVRAKMRTRISTKRNKLHKSSVEYKKTKKLNRKVTVRTSTS